MPFDVGQENGLDLDVLFKDINVSNSNVYIADEDKAVELVSELITNKTNYSLVNSLKKIKKEINTLFSLFSEVSIDNEMILYERFMYLCSRLSERQRIKKIQDKVVISFGGKVSAGKSKFINTISGIGDKLPVDQKTTTAIPTYIVKAEKDSIYANSVYGYSTRISNEKLNAMAHEFDYVYGIGFSAFVDSIIIESSEYTLPSDIALLDTPGYTKYDEQSDSRMVISDRQKAYDQLRATDYLIWLIDIDNGVITEDDIQFIESLHIRTPILIVFTKADLKSDEEIKQIVKAANESIIKTTIDCFGITAYSANLRKEYNNNLIEKFLDYSLSGNVRNNDIRGEFKNVEEEMRKEIVKKIDQYKKTAKALFSYISKSNQIMDIRSLAMLWGKANQDGYKLEKLLRNYDDKINRINKDMEEYFREGESE